MRIVSMTAFALALAIPLLAGALALQVTNPADNPEAQSQHMVVLARTTACHSPEKTQITATAEGMVNNARQSLPLHVVALSSSGTFGIAREWPAQGKWVVKVVAHNPEYKNYATGALVVFVNGSADWHSAKTYFHQPSEVEVAALLNAPAERASLR